MTENELYSKTINEQIQWVSDTITHAILENKLDSNDYILANNTKTKWLNQFNNNSLGSDPIKQSLRTQFPVLNNVPDYLIKTEYINGILVYVTYSKNGKLNQFVANKLH